MRKRMTNATIKTKVCVCRLFFVKIRYLKINLHNILKHNTLNDLMVYLMKKTKWYVSFFLVATQAKR